MSKTKLKTPNWLLPWLDVFAVTAWGILILKYWITDKLNLLIHPDYFWLALCGSIGLIIIGVSKGLQLLQRRRDVEQVQHLSLFPPGWSSGLLLGAAILGLIITPHVFASQVALQRGVTDMVAATRSQPQAFHATQRPEKRTLIDWVRTLNAYPEPDAYTGQKVKVEGFVVHPPELTKDYLWLARFVITCCAADAYPVGLPVKLQPGSKQYPADSWLEVEGQMITENLEGKRQLTIAASSEKTIPEPKDPYSY